MLRGENMRFRPALFIWFVFAQSFFKFHKNDGNRKLKAWSFRLRKNDFCRLYNERARALQSSITFFLIHPVYQKITFIHRSSTRSCICMGIHSPINWLYVKHINRNINIRIFEHPCFSYQIFTTGKHLVVGSIVPQLVKLMLYTVVTNQLVGNSWTRNN